MIETVDDFLQCVAEGDEIDHALLLIEWAGDFGGDSIIVSVQALAEVIANGNEVRGTEHQKIFGTRKSLETADVEVGGHGKAVSF